MDLGHDTLVFRRFQRPLQETVLIAEVLKCKIISWIPETICNFSLSLAPSLPWLKLNLHLLLDFLMFYFIAVVQKYPWSVIGLL